MRRSINTRRTRRKMETTESMRETDLSATEIEYQTMDVSLWANFPEHLLQEILARLPIQSFFRFRVVCKSWNDLVHSGSFLKSCEHVLSEGPWFLVYPGGVNKMQPTYDPSLNKWLLISLPSLPQIDAFQMASDGGLVCFYTPKGIVVVLNPLTKAWRSLPPMDSSLCLVHTVRMVTNRVTNGYQVFVVGRVMNEDSSYIMDVEVYDSRNNSWHSEKNLSSKIAIGCNLDGRGAAYSSGCVVVICYNEEDEPTGLLAYSLVDHTWSRIAIPFPAPVCFEKLLQCGERTFMIGGRQSEIGGIIVSICLWELHYTASWEWVLVDIMPDELFHDFLYIDYADDVFLSCTGCRNLVLLLSSRSTSDCPGLDKHVIYDFEKKQWSMVQSYDQDHHTVGHSIWNDAIGYEPRLNATV